MKNIINIFCLTLTIILATTCSQKDMVHPPNVSGVSLELAQFRKNVLSNIHYKLSLDIPDSLNNNIKGAQEIMFNLSKPVSNLEIDFEEEDDHLISILVNDKPAEINHKNEHIILPGELLVKGNNRVAINFIAGESSLNRSKDFLFSLLVPERARTFFPCFDQPNLKATFKISVSVPSTWEAISNARINGISTKGNRKMVNFNQSDTISTYLFSIVAGKFQKVSRTNNGKEMNFYHRETDTSKIRLSINSIFYLHEKSLNFMENYTGIKFPFQKFDFIAIPDFQYGGMEHVGAIDYRASTLFLDKSADINDKTERAHLIAHETAHMWFGNLVTMDWFNDVWMKEVFANFMADKILSVILPDSNTQKRFLLNNQSGAYYVDRTKGTHPIRQELANLDHAGTLYGNIIYQKAPIVMKQLEKIVGESIMQKGLKKYLNDFAFKNANWPQLIKIIDRFSSEDIHAWNDQWVNKKGRPVFTYKMRQHNGTISNFTISQKSEDGTKGLWKQYFTIAFVYNNSIKEIKVNMNDTGVVLKEAFGLALPEFLLFNSSGEGYGLFPIDKKIVYNITSLNSPVMRASACINMYEAVLGGKELTPNDLLLLYGKLMSIETDAEILYRICRQFKNTYWQFILPKEREKILGTLETYIWDAICNSPDPCKKILFDTYISISTSPKAIDKIYQIWKAEKAPEGIFLSEEDYTSISAELAIRNHPQTHEILNEQLKRIKNTDRKLKFQFLLKVLSNDIIQRSEFFESLSESKNREKEVWVKTSLYYLHHPLRAFESEKYLLRTLELLDEVRSTGDIFFPSNWLEASFNYYQSKSAMNIVQAFLKANPKYDESLKRIILQETDDLYRSQVILNH